MSDYTNRAIVLNQRPQGEIQDGDLKLIEKPVRELKDGEVLAKTLWLSLDPYMRPRMNDSRVTWTLLASVRSLWARSWPASSSPGLTSTKRATW